MATNTAVWAITAAHQTEVSQFIDEMVSKHGFDDAELASVFDSAEVRSDIIEAISRPAEKKPWYEYRPIFLQDARIEAGAEFWRQHRASLSKAYATYGVDEAIIVSIIGVETRYGRYAGRYRVIDALSTLAFAYPPRSRFFRSELEQYLLMTREQRLDPLDVKGSYAGAMGQPQFISSSFRRYAVDFDGDGHIDIWNNTTDAIGSVANYLNVHGWQRGQTVAFQTQVDGVNYEPLLENGLKPSVTIDTLRRRGIAAPSDLPADMKGKLIRLEAADGYEYWVGLQNFYAITRYNHSALYAMAVFQLSQAIRSRLDSLDTAKNE